MKQLPELESLFRSGLPFFAERRQGLTYQHFQLGMPGRWGGVGTVLSLDQHFVNRALGELLDFAIPFDPSDALLSNAGTSLSGGRRSKLCRDTATY
jgi:hypothetical protein